MAQSQSTYEDAIDKILRPSKDESVNVAKIAFSGAIEDTVTYMKYTKSYNIVRMVMKIHRNMILRYFKLRYPSSKTLFFFALTKTQSVFVIILFICFFY